MKRRSIISTALIALIAGSILPGCKKDNSTNNDEKNKPPVCSITAPANNATFTTADSIKITVAASDTDGGISKVDIYVDNVAAASPKTTPPFEFTLAAGVLAAGTHTIKAVATDNKAASADASITIVVNSAPTIYVAGYATTAGNGVQVAQYWKSGVATSLTANPAELKSIFVSGSDVYAAGFEAVGSGYSVAKVWKNGVGTALTDGTQYAYAYSVYVSGGDVYVAGFVNHRGKIWKNGVETAVTLNSNTAADLLSVFVSGSDVYAAGMETTSQGYQVAKVWKNGTPQSLSSETNFGWAYSVYVSGSDVYVAGDEYAPFQKNVAKVWKNGVETALTNGTAKAQALSVYVSGNDVYVAGYEANSSGIEVAKVWKNGVATPLTDGSRYARAQSVYVNGNDVYAAGLEYDISGQIQNIRLWKNGTAIALTDGLPFGRASAAASVFVK